MRQYHNPTNFYLRTLHFTQDRKWHERRVNGRARENEDHIYGPTHSRPNRPRSYLGIDLIVSCSLSLSLSRTGRWNRENCHCHGRPSTMTTSAKREKKKTLRSPCLRPRPSLIETQKQKKTARARSDPRANGWTEGGKEGHAGRAHRAQPPRGTARATPAGPTEEGGGRGPETTTGSLHREYVRERARLREARRGRGVGPRRRHRRQIGHASWFSNVCASVRVRPSVCSFPHASYSCEWRAAPAATVEEEEEEEDRRRPGSCHRRHAPTLTRPSPDDNKCRRARTATRGRDRDRRRRRPSVVVIYDQKLRRRKREGSVRRPSAVGSQQWQRMRSELLIE